MNEMPAVLAEPLEPLVKSLTRINRFMVGQMEKWVALQLDSLKAYADLGMAQIKVGLNATDPQSLHEFADSQCAVLGFVGHRMVDDGRALAEWGVDCHNRTHRLARENLLSLLFKD